MTGTHSASTDCSAITDYWDAAAAGFDDEPDHGLQDAHTRAAWEELLRGRAPGRPGDILDVGCGTGTLSVLLAASGHRVTGVDLAPRMVEQARAKGESAGLSSRFLVGDAAAPPTGEERFDMVLSRHLVWTLPDPEAALREWTARLRPGGTLLLIEGRWREAGQAGAPYTAGVEQLPWHGGIRARDLASSVAPLATSLRIEDLGADADLWGGPVEDERYALVAQV